MKKSPAFLFWLFLISPNVSGSSTSSEEELDLKNFDRILTEEMDTVLNELPSSCLNLTDSENPRSSDTPLLSPVLGNIHWVSIPLMLHTVSIPLLRGPCGYFIDRNGGLLHFRDWECSRTKGFPLTSEGHMRGPLKEISLNKTDVYFRDTKNLSISCHLPLKATPKKTYTSVVDVPYQGTPKSLTFLFECLSKNRWRLSLESPEAESLSKPTPSKKPKVSPCFVELAFDTESGRLKRPLPKKQVQAIFIKWKDAPSYHRIEIRLSDISLAPSKEETPSINFFCVADGLTTLKLLHYEILTLDKNLYLYGVYEGGHRTPLYLIP